MTTHDPIFEAIQLASVRRPELQAALKARNLSWEAACHVTATSSLTEALWASGDLAVSIAVLLDLLVVGSRVEQGAGSLSEFPAAVEFQNREGYRKRASDWSGAVEGVKVRRAMEIDDALRRFARTRTSDANEARLLVRERREFQRAVQTLVAAGLSPASSEFQPRTPIALTARDAWCAIEGHCPDLAQVREDLWQNQGTPELVSRCRAVLARVFGPRARWTIVHHGFYFYTPPHWALFQFLRQSGLAHQLFIVHDDGASPMFEIWRRFFSSRWMMPEPKRAAAQSVRQPTPQATALRAAWRGEQISVAQFGQQLQIVEYRSPAEFVRSTLHSAAAAPDEGKPMPRLFAAQQSEVERYCERLGPLAEGGRTVLAQLPVGAFLLRLHECIQGAEDGTVRLVLTADAVRDIATSGFLALPAGTPSIESMRAALSRAMPFFRDCKFASEWDERAASLERTVVDVVGRLGARDLSHTDAQRLATAAGNPMRLAPWADISESEAKAIRLAIQAITRALGELARSERIHFKQHAEFVARHVRQGVASLPPEERDRVDSKLRGFSIGLSGDVDVTGLIDVVRLLLGRDADHTAEDGVGSDDSAQQGAIRPLRALDALGLSASKTPIHLANLADGAFPSAVPAVGWPFRREDIADPLHIGRGLLETRSEHSALGDLYLLWLALDGVESGVSVTVSWISDIAGDPRSPSSVLSMLRRPTERSLDAVAEKIGGLEVSNPPSSGDAAERLHAPKVPASRATKGELDAALKCIPPSVAAMTLACPRWLATHWMFGPTVAHSADFQHSRLHGNLLGALQKSHGMTEPRARECVDGLWRFLTQGERASSRECSVVKSANGAKSEWLLTLDGSKYRSDPIAQAYKSAAGYDPAVSLPVLQVVGDGFLPPPAKEKRGNVCKFCPAHSRCLQWRRSIDETD